MGMDTLYNPAVEFFETGDLAEETIINFIKDNKGDKEAIMYSSADEKTKSMLRTLTKSFIINFLTDMRNDIVDRRMVKNKKDAEKQIIDALDMARIIEKTKDMIES